MNDLAQLLNHDVVYCIQQHTINDIKNDTLKLLNYFNDHHRTPVEPSGGRQYNIWVQYMINYTKNIKPVEDKFINLCIEISESKDFDKLQKLYPQVKDTFDEWYNIKRKIQFSGYYNYE